MYSTKYYVSIVASNTSVIKNRA